MMTVDELKSEAGACTRRKHLLNIARILSIALGFAMGLLCLCAHDWRGAGGSLGIIIVFGLVVFPIQMDTEDITKDTWELLADNRCYIDEHFPVEGVKA